MTAAPGPIVTVRRWSDGEETATCEHCGLRVASMTTDVDRGRRLVPTDLGYDRAWAGPIETTWWLSCGCIAATRLRFAELLWTRDAEAPPLDDGRVPTP